MPELPEVEHFRSILLPLVVGIGSNAESTKDGGADRELSSVVFECPPPHPTKRFPSQDVFDLINTGGYAVKDVLRKGKVLCVILVKQNKPSSAGKKTKKNKKGGRGTKTKPTIEETSSGVNDNEALPIPSITGQEKTLYLSLHMGMTGRISCPTHVPGLESLSENDQYPPPHTHLIIKSNGEEAAFSDPRRFGSVLVDVGADDDGMVFNIKDSIPTFRDITTDALEASEAHCMKKSKSKGASEEDSDEPTIVEKLANRKKGIKGLLLDQRAVISGVGNWVADEVLYRSRIHPDQSYLTIPESQTLVEELYHVLSTAITSMNSGWNFPNEWLFHRRWRNSGGGGSAKDFNGKRITFIQSGGRSTAVVPSLQKLMGRKSVKQQAKPKKTTGKKAVDASSNKSIASQQAKPKKIAATRKKAVDTAAEKSIASQHEKTKKAAGKKPAGAAFTKSTEEGKRASKSASKQKMQPKKTASSAKKANQAKAKVSKAEGQKRKRTEDSLHEPDSQTLRRSKRLSH